MMQNNDLPIIPFGKYKNQPITNLIADKKYLDWCKQQEWFKEKFPIVYNICVNQTITNSSQNSRTPEHNKMQNLFLDNDNVEKLFRINSKFCKDVKINPGNVIFEGQFNWDIILRDYQLKNCGLDCDICSNYSSGYILDLYCEIKTLLSDDYPCVLRKMKTQIQLTEKGISSNGNSYVLLVKDFNSSSCTKEQLITIFNQAKIKVIFLNELFDISYAIPSYEIIHENFESLHIEEMKQTILKLENENHFLKERISEIEFEMKNEMDHKDEVINTQKEIIQDYEREKFISKNNERKRNNVTKIHLTRSKKISDILCTLDLDQITRRKKKKL